MFVDTFTKTASALTISTRLFGHEGASLYFDKSVENEYLIRAFPAHFELISYNEHTSVWWLSRHVRINLDNKTSDVSKVSQMRILAPFSQKGCQTLACSLYDINLKCAGKPWPWRVEWWVKLANPTILGRPGHFWSGRAPHRLKLIAKNLSTNFRRSGNSA